MRMKGPGDAGATSVFGSMTRVSMSVRCVCAVTFMVFVSLLFAWCANNKGTMSIAFGVESMPSGSSVYLAGSPGEFRAPGEIVGRVRSGADSLLLTIVTGGTSLVGRVYLDHLGLKGGWSVVPFQAESLGAGGIAVGGPRPTVYAVLPSPGECVVSVVSAGAPLRRDEVKFRSSQDHVEYAMRCPWDIAMFQIPLGEWQLEGDDWSCQVVAEIAVSIQVDLSPNRQSQPGVVALFDDRQFADVVLKGSTSARSLSGGEVLDEEGEVELQFRDLSRDILSIRFTRREGSCVSVRISR